MAVPSSVAQALNAAAPSLAYNRLRLDALGSLEADSNGVTTNGGGNFLNNAGTTRVVGDVVIQDTTLNDAFTTTTVVADGRVLGVVNDASVVNAVRGAVQTRGPALVNVTGSVARGEYLVTSATIGLAQSNGPSLRPGVFAVALEANSGGTVVALLFGAAVFSPPANQLVNGGFEIWQRGNGPYTSGGAYTSDRWQIGLAGTDTNSVVKDTTNQDTAIASGGCAACTFVLGSGAGASTLGQTIKIGLAEFPQMAGRTVTLSVRVKTATANAVRIGITGDGAIGTTYSAYHAGDGAYHTLVIPAIPIPSSGATTFSCNVYFAASCTAYIDNAMLVYGSVAWDYVPLPPADDLARCLRYYELLDDNGGGSIIVRAAAAGAAVVAGASFPYRAVKAAAPTVTKVGTWAVVNTGQPTIAGSSKSAVWLQTSSSAAGDFYALDSTAGNNLSIEANP